MVFKDRACFSFSPEVRDINWFYKYKNARKKIDPEIVPFISR